ncbi:phosphoglycerate mutase [Comamonas composti]|uniref:phosphoglycerate mutase n=1 Tax=Comamonas composti TaxID=408558 RepID=UPI0004032A90|nr:phosphoglycerate mutase [Comamonas composti]
MFLTAPLVSSAHVDGRNLDEYIICYAGGPSANATAAAPADDPAWAGLQLPHLQALLALLSPDTLDSGSEMDFSPPHERALARTMGLPHAPGLIPWAAWRLGPQEGKDQACAFITPCHWHIGADQVRQGDPAGLEISEEESRQLLALLSPWFVDDGITLEYLEPQLWLARGALFEGLATASMDRVIGRDVRPWLPTAEQSRSLQRLQSEVQMLLYTHVFNDARAAQGLAPVNAIWIHGAGSLPAQPAAQTRVQCIEDLRAPALNADTLAWRQAFAQLDATLMAGLLERVRCGQDLRLTLCGERNAQSWNRQPLGWPQKIKRLIRGNRMPDLRNTL